MWIVCGELHADLVVETDWLLEHGCKLPESVKPYKYVCLGWGDHIAYTYRWGWSDVPKALFWPSDSIVQVVGFDGAIEDTFPDMETESVSVAASGGADLANFINHSFSFTKPTDIEPITVRESKWGHGYFVQSPYSYYFPRLCNQWVSTALRAAGVHTTRPTATMSSNTLVKSMQKYKAEVN